MLKTSGQLLCFLIKTCCPGDWLGAILHPHLHKSTTQPGKHNSKYSIFSSTNVPNSIVKSCLVKSPCWCLSSVRRHYCVLFVILPPSLSLTSPQAVSIEVSQPVPLQPSWHTQYQPLLPRVHLPFPLHKPGQPSVQQKGQRLQSE